jgi:hypothetical protein
VIFVRREAQLIRVEVRGHPPLTLSQQGGEAETVESPVLGNGHAGFGERPAETGPEQSGNRAPGRLNPGKIIGAYQEDAQEWGHSLSCRGTPSEATTLRSEHDERNSAAVSVIAGWSRMMARQLRTLAPVPLGLVNDDLQLPAFVGSHSQGGEPETVMSMTLCYGIPEDPLSRYIEVITDFTPDQSATLQLRSVLSEAAEREKSRQEGMAERERHRHRPPRGPLAAGTLEVSIAGQERTISTKSYDGFHGLRLSHAGIVATVISRGTWPARAAFDLITNLEPYLTAIESPDSEVVKAKVRSLAGTHPNSG